MIKRNDGISKDDICQNQFTAYVVLAVRRKRQSYIKKKQRDNEKESRTKKEAEKSEFITAGYDIWSRMEPQNEKLMTAIRNVGGTRRLGHHFGTVTFGSSDRKMMTFWPPVQYFVFGFMRRP